MERYKNLTTETPRTTYYTQTALMPFNGTLS